MKPLSTAQASLFLPSMPDVARCELSLQELHQAWRLIEASAKMNCPVEARLLLPAMVSTRTGFSHLEGALIANLVQEKIRNVLAEIATKAQYAIDILVRNLFERTADVGFLATDTELCRFVAGLDTDHARILQRLSEYRAKYSVYDQILLLDASGKVLAQADPAQKVGHSDDALVAATLASDGYVETFRATELRPGHARALVYSHRMRDPDSGAVVGVLCLCFNFEQEMAAIFAAYRDPRQRANMLLLDAHDRVIASADALWVPVGAQVPTNADDSAEIHMFSGREYLVRTFRAAGYQGYPGPSGWQGQVMIPLDLAFRAGGADALAQFEPAMLQGLLAHAHSFNPALHELMSEVRRTTRTIERIVWNGKVTSAASGGEGGKLNALLDQITDTGSRSDTLFSHSIQDLYRTVLTSSVRAAEYTSQLLVDMLDRNLYERANDCRWWALTAQLREGLARPGATDQSAAIGSLLAEINGLYTVYSRLFVYERSGRIVASTGSQDIVGSSVDADTLGRVCALQSVQDHYPEPFGPAALYDGRATFVYHAAVRHPDNEATVVGGIGIVFDGEPELLAMLAAGVAERAKLHAYFVTPDGTVLSSTDPDYPPGAQLDIDKALLAAGAASVSRIVLHRGQYVLAAATGARGYREFRVGQASEQAVVGVVLQVVGAAHGAAAVADPAASRIAATGDIGRDYATFFAGDALLALPADQILEAVPFARVQRTASGNGARIGLLDTRLPGQQPQSIWVFDLGYMIAGRATVPGEDSQVILARHQHYVVGLLVDELHSVQRFADSAMSAMPQGVGTQAWAQRLIMANDGKLLIQEVALDPLFARLRSEANEATPHVA